MDPKRAVIIGAGPAGLTAAYELLDRTDLVPLVLEASNFVGGISRTVNYKGNRIDLGGHRFFSKSDRVMQWWLRRMPLQKLAPDGAPADGRQPTDSSETQPSGSGSGAADRVMLLRRRKSRIYFLRKFFDYPVRLNADTIAKLGIPRVTKMALSYARAALFASRSPRNLEEFFISRFGRELYQTFFQSYTEKVWGVRCSQLSAEWGAQRVKGLSIGTAMLHFLRTLIGRKAGRLGQKGTETSLIEEFLYPKYGPGQMWETVADEVTRRGGQILLGQRVQTLHVVGDRIAAIDAVDTANGHSHTYAADYVFSTMPVNGLVAALDSQVPENVRAVAGGLMYRDLIMVGMLVKRLKIGEPGPNGDRSLADNWIYLQEPDVKAGRIQFFNNWSPYMVADPATKWIGVEYFCFESDDLWKLADAEVLDFAKTELARIGIIDAGDVLDGTVLRVPKAYPAYFGTYDRFAEVRAFVDQFANLFLIGRNGMHKYNNQDHSMLAAMTAVDNLVAGRADKGNVWDVNTEQDYHEA